MTGTGELRNRAGRYVGHLVMAGRTILLEGAVHQDGDGRFFALSAELRGDWYTEAELDGLRAGPAGHTGIALPQDAEGRTRMPADPIPTLPHERLL